MRGEKGENILERRSTMVMAPGEKSLAHEALVNDDSI